MLGQIKNKIQKDLTGNFKQDFLHLEKQKRHYARHALVKEILPEIELIQFAIIPKEKQDLLLDEHDEAHEKYKKEIDLARDFASKKNFAEAESILANLAKFYEFTGIYNDDSMNECRRFHNYLENLLYRYYFNSNKNILQIDDPYMGPLYITYAEIFFMNNKFEQAIHMAKKALSLNPVDAKIMLMLSEIYKKNKNLDELYTLSKQLLLCAYASSDVATAYRNIGYYFNETGKYPESVAAYCISYQYDSSSPHISTQLGDLKRKLGKNFSVPKIDKIQSIFAENSIQFGMPNATRHYLVALIERYTQKDHENLQKYYIDIFNDIYRTYDDLAKNKLET